MIDFPELMGWDELEKKASNDPKSGRQTEAIVGAAKNITLSIANLRGAINDFRSTVHDVGNHLAQSTGRVSDDIEEASQKLEITLDNLSKKIENFSQGTSRLSAQANKFIMWYTVLTAVIAIATVVNLIIAIIK